METLGYLAVAWLVNVSLNAVIAEEPKPICHVQEVINEKTTYVPQYCEDLNG